MTGLIEQAEEKLIQAARKLQKANAGRKDIPEFEQFEKALEAYHQAVDDFLRWKGSI